MNKESDKKKVIAVVGLAGAGKTTVSRYIRKKLDCPNVYFGQPTFDRLEADGLEVNYENEKMIREKIREELGPAAYAKLSLPNVEKALEKADVCLVESLYSWAEYRLLKERFGPAFICLAAWASPPTRLERLLKRRDERPIKGEKEFIERDYSEIENTHKAGPIARADYLVVNENAKDALFQKIDLILDKIISS